MLTFVSAHHIDCLMEPVYQLSGVVEIDSLSEITVFAKDVKFYEVHESFFLVVCFLRTAFTYMHRNN